MPILKTRPTSQLSIALYQPDIPQNTGTILRMGACLGVKVHIIEPTGFVLSDTGLKRAGMDYLEIAAMQRHVSIDAFCEWRVKEQKRLILLTTKTDKSYSDITFDENDILLFGRESSGVPESVHALVCLLYTSPSPRDQRGSRMPSSA